MFFYFLTRRKKICNQDCFTYRGHNKWNQYALGDIWTDIKYRKLFNEGGIDLETVKTRIFVARF